jgi:hypothetical protein
MWAFHGSRAGHLHAHRLRLLLLLFFAAAIAPSGPSQYGFPLVVCGLAIMSMPSWVHDFGFLSKWAEHLLYIQGGLALYCFEVYYDTQVIYEAAVFGDHHVVKHALVTLFPTSTFRGLFGIAVGIAIGTGVGIAIFVRIFVVVAKAVDQWISGSVVEGAPTEEPRPDASNARSQRPATRAIGVSRALACVLKHLWSPTGVLHSPRHPSCAGA